MSAIIASEKVEVSEVLRSDEVEDIVCRDFLWCTQESYVRWNDWSVGTLFFGERR